MNVDKIRANARGALRSVNQFIVSANNSGMGLKRLLIKGYRQNASTIDSICKYIFFAIDRLE
jgi:hypothetical protein